MARPGQTSGSTGVAVVTRLAPRRILCGHQFLNGLHGSCRVLAVSPLSPTLAGAFLSLNGANGVRSCIGDAMPMNHFVAIGSAPSEEACSQVGSHDFARHNEREARVLQRMLSRHFPVPEGIQARITVKCENHDFGPYLEVRVLHDDSPAAADFALAIEAQCPARWDQRALAELVWFRERDRHSGLVHAGSVSDADVPELYRGVLPPDELPSIIEMLRSPSKAKPVVIDPHFIVRIADELFRLVCSHAADDDIHLHLVDEFTGELFATVTTVIANPVYVLAGDEVFVKTWSENASLIRPLLNCGLFYDTGLRERAGLAMAQVWGLTARFIATFGTYDLRRAA